MEVLDSRELAAVSCRSKFGPTLAECLEEKEELAEEWEEDPLLKKLGESIVAKLDVTLEVRSSVMSVFSILGLAAESRAVVSLEMSRADAASYSSARSTKLTEVFNPTKQAG